MKSKIAMMFTLGLLSVAMLTACSSGPLEHSGENTVTAHAASDTLTVMTYNVKNCDLGEQIDAVAADIMAENPDVVCVQEIDKGVNRSGDRDVLKELASAVGMNYHFYPAIHYQGGTYGVGILSVYPLELCDMVPLEVREEDEGRVLASAVINVGGRQIKIFNTHLSFEDAGQRQKQWAFLQTTLDSQQMPFILTGDFNVSSIDEFSILTGVNSVNNAATPYETFIGGEVEVNGFTCLDNIFVSNDMTLLSGKMAVTTVSDHRPLVAEIQL